jgi:hypothetical protein
MSAPNGRKQDPSRVGRGLFVFGIGCLIAGLAGIFISMAMTAPAAGQLSFGAFLLGAMVIVAAFFINRVLPGVFARREDLSEPEPSENARKDGN